MLQRLFHILRKTGHRVVVVDPDTERAYVLLPFSAYEDLLDRAGDDGDARYDDELDDEWEHVASTWHEHEDETWGSQPVDHEHDEEEVIEEAPLPVEVSPSPDSDLTPPDLIDTINRDIAAWRAGMAGKSPKGEQMPEEAAPLLDDLTLTPVPGEEAAPASRNGSTEEEKFYIEPV